VAAAGWVLLCRDALLRARLARLLGLSEKETVALVVALLALHDLGKFGGRFQNCRPTVADWLGAPRTDRPYSVRHDTLGLRLWDQAVYPALWSEDWIGFQEVCDFQLDGDDYFRALMKPIFGHHGRPPQLNQLEEAGAELAEENKQAAKAYAADAFGLLLPSFPEGWKVSHVEAAERASWTLAGLAVAADWIGSNEERFPYCSSRVSLREYWENRAKPQARRAVEETGLFGASPSEETGLQALFPGYTPTPMQACASSLPVSEGPELFVVEDATGSGKTEAATVITHREMARGHADGVYYGLPTMATANAMYDRIAEDYRRLFANPEAASVVLAHSARDLSETFQRSIQIGAEEDVSGHTYDAEGTDRPGEAQCAAWLADSRKKALLGQVGVGTIDQALLGALPSDHQSLRLLGMGQSVLIVDEVHAYDDYVQELLGRLLEFQGAQGGTAILLSATLPQQMRQALVDRFVEGARRGGFGIGPVELQEESFPLVTHVSESARNDEAEASEGADAEGCTGDDIGEQAAQEIPVNEVGFEDAQIRDGYERTVRVKPLRSIESVIDRLVEDAKSGQCACWVCNTVPDARSAWEKLRRRFRNEEGLSEEKVELFHARFAQADRDRIEQAVLRRYGKKSGPADRRGRVLVATQVIEQSLDVDFDDMVSDQAPVDLILQRVGRERRHARSGDGKPIGNGADERGIPEVGLFGPPPTQDPSEDWYESWFPRAAYVYPDVARLWLSTSVLEKRGEISVPGGVRDLIESVYGPDALSEAPDVLREAARKARDEQKKKRSVAHKNALTIESGYGAPSDQGQWTRDENAPTRLGEPTTTLRLARLEDGTVLPWATGCDTNKNSNRDSPDWGTAWARSELRVRTALVGQERRRSGKRRTQAEAAKAAMPDRGKWSTLVVLKPEAKKPPETGEQAEMQEDRIVWVGRARNSDDDSVEVRYTEEEGLSVETL
jgi:CRISPR-associated endonuclease/helicase Cas3